jgi:hypothetical protein
VGVGSEGLIFILHSPPDGPRLTVQCSGVELEDLSPAGIDFLKIHSADTHHTKAYRRMTYHRYIILEKL